jgi:hypothetical protein
MSSIFKYIDYVFYINLDSRTDRWEHIENIFYKYDIDKYERFSAIYNDEGIIGCTMSHKKVIEIARERGYKNVLILEDDFDFLISKEEFEKVVEQMFVSGFDGDVCMFSYNLIQYNDCIGEPHKYRVLEAQTASCYLVMSHYYDTLIDNLNRGVELLIKTREHWNYANDQYWKVLQKNDLWYASTIRVGKQLDGYSDNSKSIIQNSF